MTPPTSPTWTIEVNPPGTMDPCRVCEHDSLTRASAHMWAYVPTAREALNVCLNCGNTLRNHPFPSG